MMLVLKLPPTSRKFFSFLFLLENSIAKFWLFFVTGVWCFFKETVASLLQMAIETRRCASGILKSFPVQLNSSEGMNRVLEKLLYLAVYF